MNETTEHRIMSNLYQDREMTYKDNFDALLHRINSLENKIQELEQKISDLNDIEYY